MEKYVRSDSALYEEIDDEAVVLNMTDGCYYGLNPTGRALWGMLARPVTTAELHAGLQEKFSEIGAAEAERDVNDFLKQLTKCDLAKIVSSEI